MARETQRSLFDDDPLPESPVAKAPRAEPVAPALVVPDHLRPGIADLVRRQRLPTPVLSQSEIDEAVDLIIVERL